MTMQGQNLHRLVARAVVQAIADNPSLTAREIGDYFTEAAKGMAINAAFRINGPDLAETLIAAGEAA